MTQSEPGHLSTGTDIAEEWSDPKTMWDQRYSTSDLVWSATPNALLANEVAGLPPGRALDLGCGEGRNAIWLAENGWDVTAVDFSTVGIEKARRLAANRGVSVAWVVADLLEYRPKPGSFDLVFLTFIHLARKNFVAVLEGARDGLDADGTLIVIGHDASNLTEGIGGPQDPDVLYSHREVTQALPDMSVEKAETIQRRVETGEGDRIAIDVLVRLRR